MLKICGAANVELEEGKKKFVLSFCLNLMIIEEKPGGRWLDYTYIGREISFPESGCKPVELKRHK